jgi:hypothetical protein
MRAGSRSVRRSAVRSSWQVWAAMQRYRRAVVSLQVRAQPDRTRPGPFQAQSQSPRARDTHIVSGTLRGCRGLRALALRSTICLFSFARSDSSALSSLGANSA